MYPEPAETDAAEVNILDWAMEYVFTCFLLGLDLFNLAPCGLKTEYRLEV